MEKYIPKLAPKLPFSGYDIFAYLSPSIIFIIFVGYFELRLYEHGKDQNAKDTLILPFFRFLKKVYELILNKDANWGFIIILLLSLLCIAYVLGHLIATVSSLSIDRVLIYKGYGYPYIQLLDIDANEYTKASSYFYRGAFFWSNAFFLYYYIYKSRFIIIKLFSPALPIYMMVCIFILAVIFKLILAIWFKGKKTIPKGLELPLRIFSFPYDQISIYLSNYINTKRAFNKEFQVKLKKKYKKIFGLDPIKSETNIFWLSYIYISEKSENANAAIANWLNLYSYARNLAFSFFMIYLYSGIILSFQIDKISADLNIIYFLLPILIFILFVLMLIRYYYLYACYYTKYIFRAFYYL